MPQMDPLLSALLAFSLFSLNHFSDRLVYVAPYRPEKELSLNSGQRAADYLLDRTDNLSTAQCAALCASTFATLSILLDPAGATAIMAYAAFSPAIDKHFYSLSAHHANTVPDRFLKNSTEASFSTALVVREEPSARTRRAPETGAGVGLGL